MPETLDPAALDAATKLEVFDDAGNEVTFGSLYADQKTIIVFIRHFFCGSCQMYTEELMRVPETALARGNTRIVLIGQGEWKAIQAFRDLTGFTGAIYAHPSHNLHSLFSFVKTTAPAPADKKPKYMKQLTYWGNIMRSWAGAFRFPSLILSAGSPALNGGDFVVGPGNQCAFFHRMQNAQDHVEVVDLMRHAGVDYTPA